MEVLEVPANSSSLSPSSSSQTMSTNHLLALTPNVRVSGLIAVADPKISKRHKN